MKGITTKIVKAMKHIRAEYNDQESRMRRRKLGR